MSCRVHQRVGNKRAGVTLDTVYSVVKYVRYVVNAVRNKSCEELPCPDKRAGQMAQKALFTHSCHSTRGAVSCGAQPSSFPNPVRCAGHAREQ